MRAIDTGKEVGEDGYFCVGCQNFFPYPQPFLQLNGGGWEKHRAEDLVNWLQWHCHYGNPEGSNPCTYRVKDLTKEMKEGRPNKWKPVPADATWWQCGACESEYLDKEQAAACCQ